MKLLFWLSIVLWVIALSCYALILSGKERLERRGARMSVFIPFEVLFDSSHYSRSLKLLYRALYLSAVGAMLTGGLFLLSGTS